MSPREPKAWTRLVSLPVVFVPYAAYVLARFGRTGPMTRPLCVAFVAASSAVMVVGVAEAVTRSLHVCPPGDERDRAIERYGVKVGYVALVVRVLGAISTGAVLGVMTPQSPDGTIAAPSCVPASRYVLISVVVAEALRQLTQAVCYRRGVPA